MGGAPISKVGWRPRSAPGSWSAGHREGNDRQSRGNIVQSHSRLHVTSSAKIDWQRGGAVAIRCAPGPSSARKFVVHSRYPFLYHHGAMRRTHAMRNAPFGPEPLAAFNLLRENGIEEVFNVLSDKGWKISVGPVENKKARDDRHD